ncbi:MAG: hotdog fold thioesterase [Bacteroidetes bacterium]|nr:hotdog fold thioesterase [Bacteroidota bacterium]
MIWKVKPTLEDAHIFSSKHIGDHLGIAITEVGDDYIKGTMPVDHRTVQPFGLLHGGASCVLAETLGSVGGLFCVDQEKYRVVGIEINANHIRGVNKGFVTGTASPVYIGKTIHVWEIKIVNPKEQMVCISRLTLAVHRKVY